MITILDLIENYLQSELGTNDYSQLLRMNESQFKEFGDRLHELYVIRAQSQVPIFEMKDNEITAFSTLHSQRYFSLSNKNKLYIFDNDIENPMKMLLYFHKVCIEDPFEFFLNEIQGYDEFKNKKDILLPILKYLQKIQPLVKEGIILISTLNYVYDWSYRESVLKMDDEDYRDDNIRELSLNYKYAAPFLDLNRGLVSCSLLNSNLVLNNPFSELIFDYKVKELKDQLSAYHINIQQAVSPLMNVSIPNFDNLQVDDFISIRKEELCFEEWRNDLKNLLSDLRMLKISDDMYQQIFLKTAKQCLKESYLKLDKKIGTSSLKSKFKSGIQKFGIGSIASFAVDADLRKALLTGLSTSATSLLFDILFQGLSQGEKAQLKHYSLFY